MDTRLFTRANRIADEACPLPEHTPGGAAAMAGMVAILIIALFEKLSDLGQGVAEVIVVAVTAGLAFLDNRQKWNRNAQCLKETIERLQREEESSGG